MGKKIIWTLRAQRNFNSIINYLEKKWGQRVTRNFINNSLEIIQILSENPLLGTLQIPEKRIYGFLLSKHNRMFYRYNKKEFIVLNIFDNRSDKSKV